MATESFTESIAAIIKSIPRGRVATYGQVARLAGNPRASRQVVWALRSLSEKRKLPWHRVINSKGRISLTGEGYAIQRRVLEREGIKFGPKDTIPLELFQWKE